MNTRILFALWGALFIICAALGFIRQRSPLVTALLTLLGLVFYIPPGWILYRSRRDKKQLTPILLISTLSLVLTLLLFIANALSVLAPQNLMLGNILNATLVVFSSPMMCLPLQGLGIFGWACLLFTALYLRKRAK